MSYLEPTPTVTEALTLIENSDLAVLKNNKISIEINKLIENAW